MHRGDNRGAAGAGAGWMEGSRLFHLQRIREGFPGTISGVERTETMNSERERRTSGPFRASSPSQRLKRLAGSFCFLKLFPRPAEAKIRLAPRRWTRSHASREFPVLHLSPFPPYRRATVASDKRSSRRDGLPSENSRANIVDSPSRRCFSCTKDANVRVISGVGIAQSRNRSRIPFRRT